MKSDVMPFIEFNITQKCNYCCEYCSQGFLNKKEPEKLIHASDEVIEGFINLLKRIGSEYEVSLIGGEPFCHPKIIEIAGRIAALGNKVDVVTNMSFPVRCYKDLIKVTGDKLNKIRGALHVAEIKDLDKNIDDIIEISTYLEDKSKLTIASVLLEENFSKLKYIEERLKKFGIDFIYLRLLQNAKAAVYSEEIENYLKPIENIHNKHILSSQSVDTTKVLCWAGAKVFHVIADGRIMRCWSSQEKNLEFQYYGNVKDEASINLLKQPMPCFAKRCNCVYPSERNAYFEVGEIACTKSN